MKIDIPAISVNSVWQGRRFRTTLFKQWQENIKLVLSEYKEQRFGREPIEVYLKFYLKYPLKSDTDNKIKPILDCLKEARIIQDDRWIFKITAEKEKADRDYFNFEIKKVAKQLE